MMMRVKAHMSENAVQQCYRIPCGWVCVWGGGWAGRVVENRGWRGVIRSRSRPKSFQFSHVIVNVLVVCAYAKARFAGTSSYGHASYIARDGHFWYLQSHVHPSNHKDIVANTFAVKAVDIIVVDILDPLAQRRFPPVTPYSNVKVVILSIASRIVAAIARNKRYLRVDCKSFEAYSPPLSPSSRS